MKTLKLPNRPVTIRLATARAQRAHGRYDDTTWLHNQARRQRQPLWTARGVSLRFIPDVGAR